MSLSLRAVVLALACLLVSACSGQAALQTLTSPEDRLLGQQTVAALQTADAGFIAAHADPELTTILTPQLGKMQAFTPRGTGATVELIDGSVNVTTVLGEGTTRRSYLAYEVDGGGRFSLVRMGFLKRDGRTRITDLYVNPLSAPAKQLTAFSLSGKSPLHYLFLGLAVASFITCLTSLVVLWRSKARTRRWLWTIGCLLGFTQWSLNWTTGVVSMQFIDVQLLGAFVLKAGMIGDWSVGFGIPIFAISVLILAALGPEKKNPPPAAEAPSEPAAT